MNENTTAGFFAYPSKPPRIGETIRDALRDINASGVIQLMSWEECRTGGRVIIQEICSQIDKCDLFCADLTALNPNVMFELGYSISKNKRIWVILDTSITESKMKFDQLRILTTVGYQDYRNSSDIKIGFFKERPYSDLTSTMFKESIEPLLTSGSRNALLYLKTRHDTDASRGLSKRIEKGKIPVVIDDPKESTVQSLAWYGTQVYLADGVVCHFTGPHREGATLHNARYALVAGMAFGFNKPLIMLEEQGEAFIPLDYRDLLIQYQTASQALSAFENWLNPIEFGWSEQQASKRVHNASKILAAELKTFQVGEYLAENESEILENYFVETAAYNQALNGQSIIFVGRKGAGKTANLLKLGSTLREDPRNLVCVIKPIAYELEGIVELIKRYKERDQKGYVVESLWKFLIYSEIAKIAINKINTRPSGQIFPHENELVQFAKSYTGLLDEDFTIRLERSVENLIGLSEAKYNTQSVEQFRISISEAIHKSIIGHLRLALFKALKETHRVAILVDNLDKAWDKSSDFDHLAHFLLGLLAAASRIPDEFRKEHLHRKTVNLSLALFIRSDIFYRIMSQAREPDKISYSKLSWQDRELLLRVIEERFVNSHGHDTAPSELWERFFVSNIKGIPIKDYIISRILPRPRDLVFLVKSAVAKAINRNHTRVEESDIFDAEKEYSQYALDSILVENGIGVGSLERILYEFAGANQYVSRKETEEFISKSEVPPAQIDSIIKHLCGVSFLGLEIANGDFRFAEDSQDYQKLYVMQRKYYGSLNGNLRYKINEPFWAFLEIKGDE